MPETPTLSRHNAPAAFPLRGAGHASAGRTLDRAALAAHLRRGLRGEVRFDDGSRALYATDASNYRQVPIGVVVPRSRADIITAVQICREHGVPVLTRGGGTSLAGQCCNVAVVLDLSKYYHRVLAIDPERRLVRVQPGIVLDAVQKKLKPHGLIFGPNPATHSHCTLGGMLGNNSCGINSLLSVNHGLGMRTSDNLEELEVLTYDGTILRVGATPEDELERIIEGGGRRGEIYAGLRALRDEFAEQIRARYPKIPRRVSGYNLDDLLPEHGCNVARALGGSEGTCVVILSATLKVVPRPRTRGLLVLGYPHAFDAGRDVKSILPAKPIGLEGMDDQLIGYMRQQHMHEEAIALLPSGKGWLLVEFGGDDKESCRKQAQALMDRLQSREQAPEMKYYDDETQMNHVWEARESGLGATAFVPGKPDFWPGWEDSAVPPERIGDYMRDLRELFDRYDYRPALYGHFGQGVIHCRVDFDLVDAAGLGRYRRFLEEASDLVVRYGGSFSGEHGDGQSRAELLPKMFGPELISAFRRFKSIWDPQWKMNPGKVIDPDPILSNLRLGTDYNPASPPTWFSYPEDQHNFSRAALRCVGVGRCRREEGGTMCPSYMVTREEQHSTRGRTRLLFEMLQGNPLGDGWRSEPVKDALDLCLSCKGCKGDCPVHVDMATYKAEFLAHYYRGRPRPLHMYAFGLIGQWARLGALWPAVTNFVERAPFFSGALKSLLGVAPQRELPRFAPATFRDWFFRRGPRNAHGSPVILWADTFNNYFHPEVARAATEFLERAGWRVIVPRAALCCGRPLYDYGMLGTARRWLRQILASLREEIRAGVPMVGLEPSCVATFRDELTNILPNNEDAGRLSRQTFLLSEFIDQKMPDHPLPRIERRAIVHGHCHHKAVMKLSAEERVLQRLGLEYEVLESGCCGMAGAFGFERDHYDVSIACGERVLLPAVRQAAPDSLVLADGFSCRTQIKQTTARQALHLSQVLELAHREGSTKERPGFPERRCIPAEPRDPAAWQSLLAFAGGAAAVAGAAAWWWTGRGSRSSRRRAGRPRL